MPVPTGRPAVVASVRAKRRPAFPPVRKEFPAGEAAADPKLTWLERLGRLKESLHGLLTGIPRTAPFQPDSAREFEGRTESQYIGNPAQPFQVRSVQARALRARSK